MKALSVLLLILGLGFGQLSQAKTISLTTTDWAPFYGSKLDDGGFIAVIVRESLKASGYDSNLEFISWGDALEQVKSGQKDILVGAYFSEERNQDYHFSLPIYSVLTGIIKKEGLPLDFYNSFEMLDEYKIGKIDQSVVSKSFDAYPFKNLTGFIGVDDGLKALDAGTIDLYVDSFAVAKNVATDIGIDPASLKLLQPPIEENQLYVLVSKNIPGAIELRDAFNKGFVQIQVNGTYDKILSRFNQN
ncbi:amino acid ABC transporter, periplasmic amino acid-binding protein, putative [Marinomonas sp. MED121]|uniref:substrate-binding periplasmic protein n=1 Tax=Marinomonas sp. MED121 TaxID=314277 RepID=UPI0000691116|nr:transporter substrate-binding domain-containing protein [Marinomonas sp. MED121]EAQ67767.1 amino acid ABC transporter, periplasmic amino acid-binding protein, putative [Marinomonas sp. MED121]